MPSTGINAFERGKKGSMDAIYPFAVFMLVKNDGDIETSESNRNGDVITKTKK